jgi:phosphoribosyl 1,2-cyclic phosphodiesterase
MVLRIINSNSQGNAYVMEASNGEALLIECGLRWEMIKQALKFKIDRVAGCLVTHSHGDHCKSVKDVLKAGIKVFATPGEHDAMGTAGHHNSRYITSGFPGIIPVGSFKFMAFKIVHDTPDPVGFLIGHSECGTVLFLTDTVYSPFKFAGLNNIIVEANYCQAILDKRLEAGENPKFLHDRVIQSHMSIANCKDLLLANDLSQVNNIVLIHLSDGNSDAARFKKEVTEITGKTVHVAEAGMEIQINKTPF